MPGPADFTKFVPGFDFLQGLVKTAGQTLPGMGQWIAPSLDPKELEKRIEQLRTVQFWLEQNARLLGATIQALEVQRMTLSTLQSMNVPMDGLRDAFTLRPGAAEAGPAAGAEPAAETPPTAPAAAPAADAPSAARPRRRGAASAAATSAPAAAGVDPMQWWGALTQQFTQLAAQALKDNAPDAARPLTDRVAEGMERAGAAVAGSTASPPRAQPKKATKKPAAAGTGARAAAPASPRRTRR